MSFAPSFPVALLNAPVLTTRGEFTMSGISVAEARDICKLHGIKSYIGHAATALIMTTLLGQEVVACRDELVQDVGQTALVFRLNARQPEGKILSEAEVESVGYSLFLLVRTK